MKKLHYKRKKNSKSTAMFDMVDTGLIIIKNVRAYIGSIFVGHCAAEVNVKYFHKFGEIMDWNTSLILHLGQDGPRVNLSFEKKL